jgi:hypothetical protein
MAVRDSLLAYYQPFMMHSRALQSKGEIIIIIVSFIIFRVSFYPYYNMTLGHNSLGLVVVLFSSSYLHLFLRKSSLTCIYLHLCSFSNQWYLAFDMRVGQCIT